MEQKQNEISSDLEIQQVEFLIVVKSRANWARGLARVYKCDVVSTLGRLKRLELKGLLKHEKESGSRKIVYTYTEKTDEAIDAFFERVKKLQKLRRLGGVV